MARETNRPITFTEAKSMAAETSGPFEHLYETNTITPSNQLMSKLALRNHLNLDLTYSFGGKSLSSYSDNRLVPFQLITPIFKVCNNSTIANQGYGKFYFNVDLGSATGIVRFNYDSYNVPDCFNITYDGNTVSSGWVGISGYSLPPTYPNNTGNPTTGCGSLYLNKPNSTPNLALVFVDASAITGTGWDVYQIMCAIPFTVTLDSNYLQSATVSWLPFTSAKSKNGVNDLTPKYSIKCTYSGGEMSKDIPFSANAGTINSLPPNEQINLVVIYHDEYGNEVPTTNSVSFMTQDDAYDTYILGTGVNSSVDACNMSNQITIYIERPYTFSDAPTMYYDIINMYKPLPAWYSDGTYHRYFDGNMFTTAPVFC